jgi:hypothetical protein
MCVVHFSVMCPVCVHFCCHMHFHCTPLSCVSPFVCFFCFAVCFCRRLHVQSCCRFCSPVRHHNTAKGAVRLAAPLWHPSPFSLCFSICLIHFNIILFIHLRCLHNSPPMSVCVVILCAKFILLFFKFLFRCFNASFILYFAASLYSRFAVVYKASS